MIRSDESLICKISRESFSLLLIFRGSVEQQMVDEFVAAGKWRVHAETSRAVRGLEEPRLSPRHLVKRVSPCPPLRQASSISYSNP